MFIIIDIGQIDNGFRLKDEVFGMALKSNFLHEIQRSKKLTSQALYVSRRKVEQNPDSSTKQGKAFSEKMDFCSLKAN